MALLVSVPGAKTRQPFGVAASSVAHLEPAMWASGDRAFGLRFS